MQTYEPMAGENISETAKHMVSMAKKTKEPVMARFNDITLTANLDGDADSVVQYYYAESNRRREEYVKSPEYKKRQRESKEAQRRQDLMLKNALAVAPEKITLRDEEGWKKAVAANVDSYGGGIISFAERWARLMEGRMANGEVLEVCAAETASLADNEGVTGFMYGCAVSILAKVWVHSEQLRRWHNLKIQIGHEGERANESGGTLNPALLRIG